MATKYLIFSVIFFGYAMFAYNRKGVSLVVPNLLKDGIKQDQIGLILSSQNLAYAISKFLGGIISDKLSSRILFSSGLLASGLAAVLFGLSDSVMLFTFAWFLNGLAQGVGWPAIAKLLKNWFDPAELGTWWSLASASANMSGTVAPLISTYIIVNYGWRSSLMFVGSLTIFAALISITFLADSPKSAKSPKASPAKTKATAKSKAKNLGSPLMNLLGTKFIWVISLCYLIVSTVKTSLSDWSQVYLMLDRRHSSLTANSFVVSVEFGGFFGGIAAGYLSDLYMRYSLPDGKTLAARGHPRMTIALVFALVTGGCLHLLYHHVTHETSTLFINQIGIALGMSVYGQIAIFGVVATQSVMDEMSGTAHAIAALAANVGSIAAGLPLATIAKHYSWSQVFYILEVVAIFALVFMFLTSKISYRMAVPTKAEKKTQ